MIDDPKTAPAKEESPQPGAATAPDAAAAGGPAGGALAEPPEEAVARLEAELDALKDRHLRLAAEYDNFRKRTARERGETTSRAQAELVARLVDALDDLARFAHLDPAATDTRVLHEGIDLVDRKFWKHFTAIGLARIDETGVPFDPSRHEAVTTAPAPDPTGDQTVGAVFQPGYRLGDLLLRPARVQVLTWQEPGRGGGETAG